MPDKLTFEILWYSGGPDHAPNRCIGRDRVRRADLSAAITCACNMLQANKSENARMAQGFYVRQLREEVCFYRAPLRTADGFRGRHSDLNDDGLEVTI